MRAVVYPEVRYQGGVYDQEAVLDDLAVEVELAIAYYGSHRLYLLLC